MHGKTLSRWTIVASICLCSAVAVVLFYVWRASRSRLPYQDSFSAGRADEWESYDGTWKVVGDTVSNDSDERGAKFLTGSPNWKDYMVEADIKLLGDFGDAGIIVRSSDEEPGVDSYSGYYVGLRVTDGYLIIGRADHEWAEYQDSRMPGGIEPFHWYHLRVVAYGCTIAASVTNQDTGLVTTVALKEGMESCAQEGRIGLRSMATGGIWKHIRVTPATKADLMQVAGGRDIPQSKPVPLSIEQTLDFRKSALRIVRRSGLTSEKAASIPSKPLGDLMIIPKPNSVVTAKGVVILTEPELYIQDSTGGVSIPNPKGPLLKVGDEVEVTGIAEPHDFSSSLLNATVRVLWTGIPDPPLAVSVAQAVTGDFDSRFIELEGYLDSITEANDKSLILMLHERGQRFQAILKGSFGSPPASVLARGSRLRIQGVCSTSPAYTGTLTPFVVLLRSGDDLQQVAGPPWWSARNLIVILTSAIFLSLLGYLFYVRAEHWRLQAVIEERQRLAHELHDTLAQSFAGIGFQLGAIRKKMPPTLGGLHDQLEVASQLVRQGHQEARRSISTLRPNSPDHIELLPALALSAEAMVSGGSVVIEASTRGPWRRIPLKVTDVLFRAGLEAIANAVRHAHATRIELLADYGINALVLTIADNGIGFVPDDTEEGFGLRGIKKRLETIGGTIQVNSTPGAGAQIEITAPLPRFHGFSFGSIFRRSNRSISSETA